MKSLLDAFGGPQPVWLRDRAVAVPELTVGDLLELERHLAALAEPPWSVPHHDDPALVAAAVLERCAGWPPRADAPDGATARARTALLLERTLGVDDGGLLDWLLSEEGGPTLFALEQAWWGVRPGDLARRAVERHAGVPVAPGGEADWPKLVATLCERYGYTPSEVRALTLSELRTLCDGGEGRGGNYARAAALRVLELRGRAREWLAGLRPGPAGDRPDAARTGGPTPGTGTPT